MGLMWSVSQSHTGRLSAVPRKIPEWQWALTSPGINSRSRIRRTGTAGMVAREGVCLRNCADPITTYQDRAVADDAVVHIHGQHEIGREDLLMRAHGSTPLFPLRRAQRRE